MALKLRRGLSANRTDIVPSEGELIYTTDTKLIYVGDGTTPGGNVVTASGGGGGSITGITDNTTGPVLTLNNTNIQTGVTLELGADIDLNQYDITGEGDITVTGDLSVTGLGSGIVSANAVNTSTLSVAQGITADIKGSVFGDDSSVIVSGIDGSVIASSLTTDEIFVDGVTLNINNPASSNAQITAKIASDNDVSLVNLVREAQTDISGDTLPYGRIAFTRDDSVGEATTSFIQGGRDTIVIACDPSSTFSAPYNLIFQNGRFGIGALTPSVELDVVGDANISGTLTAGDVVSNAAGTPAITSTSDLTITVAGRAEITGGTFKLANLTDTERDAITAENGDMIYNTDDNTIQAYVNGAWYRIDTSPIV